MHAFQRGSTAEEIVYQFPALALADVYDVISYYLNHQADVEGYIAEQEAERDEVRREIEARHPPDGIRERLLARNGPNCDNVKGTLRSSWGPHGDRMAATPRSCPRPHSTKTRMK
ncbi:hypothetical protein DYH09_25090 [bacterium CPR1]|nr:hypothetical protein [bacterium CPR1]